MAGATDFEAIHLRDPEPGWPRLPVGDRSWSREVRPEHCLPGAKVEGRNHAMRSLHSIATIGSANYRAQRGSCLLYTSPSPRDLSTSRMPSSA